MDTSATGDGRGRTPAARRRTTMSYQPTSLHLLSCICTLSVLAWTKISAREVANDHCQFETFNATCRPNEAVVLTSARYGRMQMGRCVTGNYGYIGCSADVINVLDVLCSGRQRCRFSVSTLRGAAQPCPGDLTAYLHTVHHCVPVMHAEGDGCRSSVSIEPASGVRFVSSNYVRHGHVASPRCPVDIRAAVGQLINITLHNFGHSAKAGRRQRHRGRCRYHAVITDGRDIHNLSLCGHSRLSQLYVSRSSRLEFYFAEDGGVTSQFLVSYDVTGCADPPPVANAWTVIEEHEATIYCNDTAETWRLTCVGTMWLGFASNCTRSQVNPVVIERYSQRSTPSVALFMAVCTGVLLGVVTGVALLTTIFVYKRQQSGRRRPRWVVGQKNVDNSEGGVEEHWVVSQPGCPHYRPVDVPHEPGYIHMVELRCNAHRSTDSETTLDKGRASYIDSPSVPGTRPARNSFVTFKPDTDEVNATHDAGYGQTSSVAGCTSVFDHTLLSSPDVLASVNSISVHA